MGEAGYPFGIIEVGVRVGIGDFEDVQFI